MKPFITVAVFWLIAGWVKEPGPWMVGLWALCCLDLVAMANAIQPALKLTAGESNPQKHAALVVSASVWGVIKLACLGIFGFILFHGHAIPQFSLLWGLGTLVTVPLIGGLWWSRKVLTA